MKGKPLARGPAYRASAGTRSRRMARAAALLTFIVAGPGTRAEEWRDMTIYPARVKAIQFNQSLEAGNSMTWWGWQVKFGPELPLAETLLTDRRSCNVVWIQNLSCSRAGSAKEIGCSLDLRAACGGRKEACSLHFGPLPPIAIDCPRAITLAK